VDKLEDLQDFQRQGEKGSFQKESVTGSFGVFTSSNTRNAFNNVVFVNEVNAEYFKIKWTDRSHALFSGTMTLRVKIFNIRSWDEACFPTFVTTFISFTFLFFLR
jgi:hypothetical protein